VVAATVAAKKTNAAAITLLLRWAQASEESNHTSQAPFSYSAIHDVTAE
jgi:hypothetical protein